MGVAAGVGFLLGLILAFQGAIHALRVGYRLDRESLLGKVALQQLAQSQVVVDDQNLGFGFGHGMQSIPAGIGCES